MGAPSLRPRFMGPGANVRIVSGEFGVGDPYHSRAIPSPMFGSPFGYHEGEIFGPGTGNWVYESPFELPVQTLNGMGDLYPANVWKVYQPPQVMALKAVPIAGLGLQLGGMDLEPLHEQIPPGEG